MPRAVVKSSETQVANVYRLRSREIDYTQTGMITYNIIDFEKIQISPVDGCLQYYVHHVHISYTFTRKLLLTKNQKVSRTNATRRFLGTSKKTRCGARRRMNV